CGLSMVTTGGLGTSVFMAGPKETSATFIACGWKCMPIWLVRSPPTSMATRGHSRYSPGLREILAGCAAMRAEKLSCGEAAAVAMSSFVDGWFGCCGRSLLPCGPGGFGFGFGRPNGLFGAEPGIGAAVLVGAVTR